MNLTRIRRRWIAVGEMRSRPGWRVSLYGRRLGILLFTLLCMFYASLRAADQIVLVSEEASGVPGFPARDTTVRFWTDRDTRYRLRIFKPAAEISETDLPVIWLLPSLIDDGDPDCC